MALQANRGLLRIVVYSLQLSALLASYSPRILIMS